MTSLPVGDRPGLFGDGALAQLPRVVRELGFSRILVLTGRSSFQACGAAAVLPLLADVAEVRTWSDFSPNPDVDDLVKGAALFHHFRPDAVIAIGGGSVLDMAKLMATLGGLEPDEIITAIRTNRVAARPVGLVAVPTTSGSGSEATHFAVAYVDGVKFSVAGRSMLPDYVVLDPELTRSAGVAQKATSVFDAFAQAVESLWARGADERSRDFATQALEHLVPALTGFLADDAEATVRAARGSHLAGRAIDISKTTGAHALSYYLTQQHGVSHGHAVATTLGGFARVHAVNAGPETMRHLERVAESIGASDVAGLGDRVDEIARSLGLELKLGRLGLTRSELSAMAESVNQERLANNPIALSATDLGHLLESRW